MNQMNATLTRVGGVNLLPLAVALVAFVLIGAPSSWMTLTVAGLAMGMMIFLMASGLSLVFGLMDVLNFGHSAFVSLGAFIAATVLAWISDDCKIPVGRLQPLALAHDVIGLETVDLPVDGTIGRHFQSR